MRYTRRSGVLAAIVSAIAVFDPFPRVGEAKPRRSHASSHRRQKHTADHRKRDKRKKQRGQDTTLTVPSPPTLPLPSPAPDPVPDPTADPTPPAPDECVEGIPAVYLETDVGALISTRTMAQAQHTRDQLIDFIWKGAGFPRRSDVRMTSIDESPVAGTPSGTTITRLDLDLIHDHTASLIHWRPANPTGRLTIYHTGHISNIGASGGDVMISRLLERGDDVLGCWMPGFSPNTPIQEDHNTFAGQEHEAFTPLMYFFEPAIVGLNVLLDQYDVADVGIIGLSGGGWTATWLAALDPRIRTSVSVVGSLPRFLHGPPCGARDWTDWEIYGSAVYDIVDYLELYVLGASGTGRAQVQILDQYDPLWFGGRRIEVYADVVHDVVNQLGGSWRGVLDTSPSAHRLTPWAIDVALGMQ